MIGSHCRVRPLPPQPPPSPVQLLQFVTRSKRGRGCCVRLKVRHCLYLLIILPCGELPISAVWFPASTTPSSCYSSTHCPDPRLESIPQLSQAPSHEIPSTSELVGHPACPCSDTWASDLFSNGTTNSQHISQVTVPGYQRYIASLTNKNIKVQKELRYCPRSHG